MIMKKVYLLDKNRSYLSPEETQKYKKQISKQKNSPICLSLSTYAVAKIGVDAMRYDQFCLVKGKIDV